VRKISSYIKAGYPVLYVQTVEQERALRSLLTDLKESGLSSDLEVFIWKITTGLYPYLATNPEADRVAQDFREALGWISKGQDGTPRPDTVYVFFNVKEMLQNPANRQQFQDTAYDIRTVGSHIIVVGGHIDLPEELTDVVTFVDCPMPTKSEIKAVFAKMIAKYKEHIPEKIEPAHLDSAACNAVGLSEFKAENAVSLSIVESRSLDVDLLRAEKQAAVKQSGVLEYVHHTESMDSLGGFDVLKAFVGKRKGYYENVERAEEFGLRPPKGLMLVGLAGTGKSLSAKAISAALQLPLFKFNIGAVFKGIVGASEAAVRDALKLAETVSPCVLLLDEFEKGFSGLESSGKTDSGVTSRVIQQLLTWMQDTRAPIYKVATCNTIRNLDAALFRRGRWDAVFAVDLPNVRERSEIFSIHLQKRGRNPDAFDLKALAAGSTDFVGAEIESVVDEALYNAFNDGTDLQTSHLLGVCKTVVPIAKTDKEDVAQFRHWMRERATPVSSPDASESRGGKGRAIRVADGAGVH